MNDDSWVWSRYWQYDRVASCMDGAGATNYDEEVAQGWRDFFESLTPHTDILDLCTGNGAIALIAAEVSRRKAGGMAITGVDKAQIDPAAHVTKFRQDLDAIRFMAGVAAEDLPFADCSFGAVVSQFGIEYSDTHRSGAEVIRVLAPGGRVRLVVHAAEGAIAAGTKEVLSEADFLLEESDLPGVAARCLEAVIAVERNPGASAQARTLAEQQVRNFREALARAAERLKHATDKAMIRNTASVLADTYKKRGYFELPELLAKVEEVRTEIVAHRGRSIALANAAVSEEGLRALCDQWGAAGLELTYSPLHKRERLIGYVVNGTKGVTGAAS